MSNITHEAREKSYEAAPAHIRHLYSDPSSGSFMRQVFTAYKLPNEHYGEFAILIGDVILGLVPRAKLIPALMLALDIDHGKAEKIDRSLNQFLGQIESGVITTQQPVIPSVDGEARDALVLKPRMTEKIVDRAIPAPGTKPLTREEILHSLAAKRTLASDVSALQGSHNTPPK
jgi:hypothetical protein